MTNFSRMNATQVIDAVRGAGIHFNIEVDARRYLISCCWTGTFPRPSVDGFVPFAGRSEAELNEAMDVIFRRHAATILGLLKEFCKRQ